VLIIYAYSQRYEPTHIPAVYPQITKQILEEAGFKCHTVLIDQPHFSRSQHLDAIAKIIPSVGLIIFSTNGYFTEGNLWDSLGSMLCEFVEEGNSVLIGTYANCSKTEGLGGKWAKKNYNPILLAGQSASHCQYFGNIENKHPALNGVSFFMKTNNHATGQVHSNGKLVASYSNGVPLIVEMEAGQGKVVSANFIFAHSEGSALGGWVDSEKNQGRLLLTNLVAYCLNNRWSLDVLEKNKDAFVAVPIEPKSEPDVGEIDLMLD